jgi:four helix bundle protein
MASTFKELRVWQNAIEVGMTIFEISKKFPPEEKYSLTDQIRRSSRSVAANISEAWRKRRYQAAFVSKLNDSETEAAETQTWLEFARRCGYVEQTAAESLDHRYEEIIGQLSTMIRDAAKWCANPPPNHPPLSTIRFTSPPTPDTSASPFLKPAGKSSSDPVR